ncbi:MAG: PorP/SprF family type IX secretion system membrane protein [Bacteroidales bacterium]|nr:PorP/SprF family type IX secretion system membrane protein [Bacteroidales bacterium]
MKTKIYILGILLISSLIISAQDPHVSPFASSAISINPAATGYFQNRDLRIHANYKNQWAGILPKGFTTTSLAIDKPISSKNIGIGVMVQNNAATTGAMKNLDIMASFGYQAQLTRQRGSKGAQYLNFGIQAGIKQIGFMPDKLTTDNQYVEDVGFDASLPSGENFTNTSKILPDFNFGALWYVGSNRSFSRADRVRILPYAGISISHLAKPNLSFYGTSNSKLPRKFLFHAGAEFQTSTKFALQPMFIIFNQGPNTQYNAGTTANFKATNDATFILGSFYRSSDAIIALTGIKYQDFMFLFSYDINTSSLKHTTNANSGIEITLRYVLTTEVRNRPFL